MHVHVPLYLTPFFGEQHRQQKAGPEQLAEDCEQSSARSRPERLCSSAIFADQIGPDLQVTTFDRRQAPENITFVTILFEIGEDVVQVGRVGLVLPVVLEGMEVGLCAVRRWNLPLRSLCHAVISRSRQCFSTGRGG
jgi:hypothetical protein